ncbi:tyrosine-type recombinase/integrase [Pseudonocardia sp. KRD-182]|uniref:tyrosine-type recombinase/integrase n=1 Tax=Pseudonocardia oceani TaxID=2792013 RepID=UPI001C4A628B|nr:tyrosine-type recombinase/integrase [Pseudonocardia oceani]MBW0111605.1 tyrosine-type recombinase/integrase [Pseudonocardia oceani]
MARSGAKRSRLRGAVDALPSGALRVRVYAGEDPLTGKRHSLIEVIPPGPQAAAQAEAARVRLLNQVDERRNPRTNATVDQLLDRYLEALDVGYSTQRMYTRYLELHVRPFIGHLKAGAIDSEVLDSLYREMRRCRTHCTTTKGVDHRTPRDHQCDERCRPHVCSPLSPTTVRQVHFVLNAAFGKGVRWRWLSINPVEFASPPPPKPPDPQPPSAHDAARIVDAAWEWPDWGALVWLTMTTGARRGELCGLRWSHVDLPSGVLTYRSAVAQYGGRRELKDTKTHQQRRVALDPETVLVLTEHWERCQARATAAGVSLARDAFVFSRLPGGRAHLVPSSVTQRYGRLVRRLGINTHLHSLRHYSATELIAAGVDVRTVAGRLGHSGGGVTTLRVYAAWLAEADQRAAGGLLARMPARPAAVPLVPRALTSPRTPREKIAASLYAQIVAGEFPEGGHLPGIKELAAEHEVAVSTVHRAFELLRTCGVLAGDARQRPVVHIPASTVDEVEPVPKAATVGVGRRLVEFRLRSAGRELSAFSAEVDPDSAAELDPLMRSAVRRAAGPDADVGDYEMDVLGDGGVLRTFVMIG